MGSSYCLECGWKINESQMSYRPFCSPKCREGYYYEVHSDYEPAERYPEHYDEYS